MLKIKGLTHKEQICFNVLQDGEIHTIPEMKNKFLSETINTDQAHILTRNSIRRLVKDGWVLQVATGTYQLTENGKRWVRQNKEITASYFRKRGPKPMTNAEKEEARIMRAQGKSRAHKRLQELIAAKQRIKKAKKKQVVIARKIKEIKERVAKQSVQDKALEILHKIVDIVEDS